MNRRVLIFQTHADNSGTQELSRLLNIGLSSRSYDVRELFIVRDTKFVHSSPNLTMGAIPARHGLLGYAVMPWLAAREIRRFQPDVILAMQWGGNMLSALIAPFAGRPAIIASQFTPFFHIPPLVQWLDRFQGAHGAFARILVNTQAVKSTFASYPPAYREKIVLIEHGFAPKKISLTQTQARAAFGLPDGGVLLGSVGRLDPQKHFDAAIRLLTARPSWQLAIAGHGVESERLRALALQLGCAGRVFLLDEIAPERVSDFLAALDVFVFPSIAETFGLAAAEAASAGIPIVANDIAVLREVLSAAEQPCALFADVDDTGRFAETVEKLLMDETLRRGLTAAGQQLVERYSLDRMYDAYDRVIREILADS
jgi:L-malate glycosyltransferase